MNISGTAYDGVSEQILFKPPAIFEDVQPGLVKIEQVVLELRTQFRDFGTRLEVIGVPIQNIFVTTRCRKSKSKSMGTTLSFVSMVCQSLQGVQSLLSTNFLVDCFNWAGQSKAWISTPIYLDWIKKVLIPYVEKVRESRGNPTEKALLVVDGHTTRCCVESLEMLKNANITLMVIPAHTSHALQPLDRGVFAVFKRGLRRYLRSHPFGTSAAEKRKALLIATKQGIHDASFDECIKTAWRVSGIWPWDESVVLNNPSLVRETFPSEVEEPQPKRRGPSVSGLIATSEEVLSELKKMKEEKSKKSPGPKTKTNKKSL